MRRLYIVAALGVLPLSGDVLSGQDAVPLTQGFSYYLDDDRPRLGISTRSSGLRDTLGLLVSDVSRGSPAEKAGLEEGDRLVSVNGVNLRLSRDDAEDEAMSGVATRRLTRELAKHKAGDAVDLRVYRDGQTRTVRATLANPEDIRDVEGTFRSAQSARANLNDRAVLGLSLGGMGSRRDTLGVLVVGVTDSGPAALAGVDEGDRIASVNGVDLRVDREDAGDWESSNARVRRLNRALEKVKPGDEVELRVYSQGQTRTVRAKAVRAADLRGRDGGFFFNGGTIIAPRAMPGVKIQPRIYYSNPPISDTQMKQRIQEQVRAAVERSREAQRRANDALRRSLETRLQYRTRVDLDDSVSQAPIAQPAPRARRAIGSTRVAAAGLATRPATFSTSFSAPEFRASSAAWSTSAGTIAVAPQPAAVGFVSAAPLATYDDGTIALGGLRLAPVDADLASYLGDGTERGLVVVRRSGRWPGVREGDVILSIDGRPVRRADGSASVTAQDASPSAIELVRGGKRISVTIER
jgi:serine protease Do